MSIRISQRSFVNIPHDTVEKGKHRSATPRRKSTFIHDCVIELIKKGETICFEKWQMEEIIREIGKDLDCEEFDGYYFLRVKNK